MSDPEKTGGPIDPDKPPPWPPKDPEQQRGGDKDGDKPE